MWGTTSIMNTFQLLWRNYKYMRDTFQQDLGRFEGKLDALQTTTEHLEKILLGNGQPGVLDRLVRIEETVAKNAENSKENTENINKLSKSVSELKESMESHHNNKDLHTYRVFLRKDIITYVIIGLLVLHSLLPANFSVWTAISKFLGI
jgi:hypothetical protein